MNSRLFLGGVLAAQIVLSAGLFVHGLESAGNAAPVPLLGFARADVDRIVVDDRTNSVTLARQGDAWQLPELQSLAANTPKLDTLLGNLEDLTTRWPVVNSENGRQRFEVQDDNYQRKLSLYRGEELLGSYYFGTSPGFRQTHVRREGEDEVYVVAFNNFDLPTDDNDWLEKSLLAVEEPTRIEGPDYALARQGGNWQLADTADAPALKKSEVDALVNAWRRMRVLRVADAVPEGAERTTVKVASDAGGWTYTFDKTGDNCFVQRSGLDARFTLAQADCDRLAGTRRAALVEATAPATPDAPATGDQAPKDEAAKEEAAKKEAAPGQ